MAIEKHKIREGGIIVAGTPVVGYLFFELTPAGDIFDVSRQWTTNEGEVVRTLDHDIEGLNVALGATDNAQTVEAITTEVATKQGQREALTAQKPEHTGLAVEATMILGSAGVGFAVAKVSASIVNKLWPFK